MSEKHKILQEAYYKNNYPSQDKLYELVKGKGISVTDTRQFLKDQLVYQLHFKPKPTPRKQTGRIVAGFENQMWMADLIDMQDVATRNRGYNYILTVIDVFSKKAQAIPIKNKGKDEMVVAFEKALKDTQPDTLKTDNGSEFLNEKMEKLFNDYDINHIVNQAGNHREMGNIEKFNQTLLNMLFKNFTDKGTLVWIDIIDDVVDTYNNSYNSAIKSTPNKYDHHKLANMNAEKAINAPLPKLKKGDMVRIRIDKGAFGRGYTQNWSADVHIIQSVTKGGLYTIAGKKYNVDDLQKIDKVETNPFKTTDKVLAQPAVRKELNTEKRLKQLDKEIGGIAAVGREAPNALSFLRQAAANPMALLQSLGARGVASSVREAKKVLPQADGAKMAEIKKQMEKEQVEEKRKQEEEKKKLDAKRKKQERELRRLK